MTNSISSPSDFKQILESDVGAIDALIQILEQEKQMLTERRIEELPSIAEKKQRQMQQLEDNFQNRINFLTQSFDGENYIECLNTFLSSIDPEQRNSIANLNQQLEQRLAQCRDLNTVNGQVISVNLQNREHLLNLVQGKSQQSTYTAEGHVQHQQNNNKHQEV